MRPCKERYGRQSSKCVSFKESLESVAGNLCKVPDSCTQNSTSTDHYQESFQTYQNHLTDQTPIQNSTWCDPNSSNSW